MRDILNDLGPEGEQEKNPMRDVQKQTSLPKRFYQNVEVGAPNLDSDKPEYSVLLDGKSVKTPAKQALTLPTEKLADQVATEWAAQETHIDPAKMPMTRMANTAIDGVSQSPDAVFEEIVRFSSTDMLFYRAQSPDRLVALQRDAWDPVLDWARISLGSLFVLTEGVMHVDQPPEAIKAFSVALRRYPSAFQLTGLHSATTLMGSALLALAMAEGHMTRDEAWAAAHVDENWNISQWGEDHEAKQRRAFRYVDFCAAHEMMSS